MSKSLLFQDGTTPDYWTRGGVLRMELGWRALTHLQPPFLTERWWKNLAGDVWGPNARPR